MAEAWYSAFLSRRNSLLYQKATSTLFCPGQQTPPDLIILGYKLQSATNLSSGEDWSAISLEPTSVGGQKIVTNPISGTQMFFRLSQPEVPSGMALIPAGTFTIGDTLDGINDATPTNVTVSAFLYGYKFSELRPMAFGL